MFTCIYMVYIADITDALSLFVPDRPGNDSAWQHSTHRYFSTKNTTPVCALENCESTEHLAVFQVCVCWITHQATVGPLR